MKIKLDQLDNHLNRSLGAVYVVSGDEPLQHQEAAMLVRKHALQRGHAERRVITINSDSDWDELYNEGSALSLFAEKKLIELRLTKAKIGDAGAKAVSHYLDHVSTDNVLLMLMPKVDGDVQKAKWFKALDAVAVQIVVWPVDVSQMPAWVSQRMRGAGLQPTPDAAQLLAERVEGNLLAAAQEIAKLSLLQQGPVDVQDVMNCVADSAKFDVFALAACCHQGDLARFAHILDELQHEGVAAPLPLWALSRELRLLANIAADREAGVPMQRSFEQHRVWDKQKKLISAAVVRKTGAQWRRLLQRAHHIDKVIKGMETGNPWDELLKLGASMSNKPLFREAL